MNVRIVELVGILKSRTLHMANTKFDLKIQAVHNEWCRENGYPVRWYKPQAGRPKLETSRARFQATSSKLQAASYKLQAASYKQKDLT